MFASYYTAQATFATCTAHAFQQTAGERAILANSIQLISPQALNEVNKSAMSGDQMKSRLPDAEIDSCFRHVCCHVVVNLTQLTAT